MANDGIRLQKQIAMGAMAPAGNKKAGGIKLPMTKATKIGGTTAKPSIKSSGTTGKGFKIK